MGANLQYNFFKVVDVNELKKQYQSYFDQLESEYGGNPYSGQLCALPDNLAIDKRRSFETEEEAIEWICEQHEKWEAPLAVRVRDGWLVGGWCPE